MMRVLARWVGCTEGQAWTLVLGLAVALWAVSAGLPPVLEPRPAPIATDGLPTDREVAGEPDLSAAPSEAPADDPSAGETDLVIPRLPVVPPPAPVDDGAGSGPISRPMPHGDGDSGVDSSAIADPPWLSSLATGRSAQFAAVPAPGAPYGIAVAPDGRVFVATDNAPGRGDEGPPAVVVFGADGTLLRVVEVPLEGAARTHGLLGLAVDLHGRVLAVDPTAARILHVDVDTGTVEVAATIPDLQPCLPIQDGPCQPGLVRRPPALRGLVADPAGGVLVTDAGQGTIWRVDPDGVPNPWAQADSWMLAAPPDGGLTGIALDPHGDVGVLVGGSLADGALGHGVIERVARTVDGRAGIRVEVARTDPGSLPTGLAFDAAGRLHVTLAGHDEVLTLAADGTEVRRVTAADTTADADVPLDRPAGIIHRPDGLLVVTGSASLAPDRWAVLRIGM